MTFQNNKVLLATIDEFDSFKEKNPEIKGKGPVGKFFSKESLEEIMKITGAQIRADLKKNPSN